MARNGSQIEALRTAVECIINHSLEGHEIHHMDGDQNNNKNSNLVVCEDRRYHMLLHRRTDALKECGKSSWRRCQYCGKYDDPSNLIFPIPHKTPCHSKCKNDYLRQYRIDKAAGLLWTVLLVGLSFEIFSQQPNLAGKPYEPGGPTNPYIVTENGRDVEIKTKYRDITLPPMYPGTPENPIIIRRR